MKVPAAERQRAALAGLMAMAFAFLWQFAVTHAVFGGNWTSFFCTGRNLKLPPQLASNEVYVYPSEAGYDSQFYHFVAHDPLFRRGLDRSIDAPRLRYRRILVPAVAFAASGGQDAGIDAALIAVNLLFVFAGGYWLSRYALSLRFHPLWGLLFLLAPAALISLDRLTVDLPLTALCVAFALYLREERSFGIYVVLLLAALARETGLLLTAAYCFTLASERRMKRAAIFATSALPALAWYAFVQAHTVPVDSAGWFQPIPLAGVIDRMIHPVAYPFVPIVKWSAEILDECALAGVLLAFCLSFRCGTQFPRPLAWAAVLFTLSGITLGKPFWGDAFAFGRVFCPLVVFIGLQGFTTRPWLSLLPAALIDPQIGLQLAYRLFQVAQAIFR